MSYNLIDIELAGIINIKDLGFFNDGNVQGYSLRPAKVQTQKIEIWCARNLHGIVWNNGCLDLLLAS